MILRALCRGPAPTSAKGLPSLAQKLRILWLRPRLCSTPALFCCLGPAPFCVGPAPIGAGSALGFALPQRGPTSPAQNRAHFMLRCGLDSELKPKPRPPTTKLEEAFSI
jgi:hypothetical protein